LNSFIRLLPNNKFYMRKVDLCMLILKSRVFAILFLSVLSLNLRSQTFYTETFDGTACAAGSGCDPSLISWTTTALAAAPGNGGAANKFYVSCQEMGNAATVCGSACATGAGDQSLHVGNVSTSSAAFIFCPGGDCGAAYDDSSPAEVTHKRAESPTISCVGRTNITIAFNYIENGEALQDDASLWYFDGTTWTSINVLAKTTLCPSGQGRWTAFSMTLPASADGNPNVKIGFVWKNDGDGNAADPSFAVDDITLTAVTATNTITTGTITGSPFCACSAVNVPFTSTGTFTAGNIYTAQLSNAAGSFAAPTNIGTLASTANTGTIAATIPCGTPTGSGYRIRVISSAPVVTGTDNGVNITITQPSVATFSYTGTPYCSTGTDPSPTFSGGGIAGTFSSTAGLVFVSTATGQVDLSASTAGTYTVTNTIAASGGCPAVTATSTITINSPDAAAFSYTGTPYCSTGTDPSPTFSGGGIAGTFSSTAGLVFVSTATGQVDLSASTAGTYTVTNTIAASGGCPAVTATSTITITTPAVATFSYTGTPYCADASDPSPTFSGGGVAGTFSSTAGLAFVSTSTGQVDLSASTAGTYTVTNTIAASGGCAAVTATSPITINPVQDSSFSYAGSTFCQSGTNPTPTITGTAGGTFTSSPAGLVFVSAATGEINLASSTLGTYSVSYTTPGPCASDMTVSVTITTAPVATFSYTGTPYCADAADPSPTFSGGGSAGTFSSTAGLVFISTATGQVDLSASTPGTYTVTNTIAASGGCPASTATSSITISAVQDPAFSYSGSTFCQTGTNPTPTITGTAGGTFSSTAGLVFVSTSTGEIDLAGSTLGTYTVTYTTAGPCAGSSTASVTITTAPVATFSYTGTPYCADAADPSPTFSGGGSAGTFSSTAGLVFASTSTGQVDLSASIPGTYTVTNTIAASGGCPASTSTSPITINPVQDSVFSYSGSTFCQTGTTTPTITGTTGGTFTSSPAGLVFVSTSTGEVDLAGSNVGSYSITYTTPGPCASSMTVSITITDPPTATFSYSGSPYCQNDPNPSPVITPPATAGTFTSTAGLVFVSASTGVIDLTASSPGTYAITNTVAASGGCPAATATFNITINEDPTVNVTSASICEGDPATLTASGTSTSYSWSSGGSSSTETVSPTTTTSYTVTGTLNGCTTTAVAVVTVTDCNEPVANFSGTPTVMCEAGCVAFTDLSTNSPTSWSWSFPGASPSTSTSQNPTNICYSADGSYDVTLIVSNSSGSDTLTMPGYITIGAPVEVTITGNMLITSCEETVLTAVPSDGTYVWSPSSTLSGSSGASVTAKPPSTQEYMVEYTSPEGCTDSAWAVVVVDDINTYFLPTGFTPNNDGVNDEIHLHGRGIDYFTLKIFDRIGEKVFETSDLEKGWNGRYLGLPMNNGVFVYTLNITFCNGENVKQHGDITLVK
jgi:gliding motility-associated-like protein